MREGFPQPTGASKRQHKRTGSEVLDAWKSGRVHRRAKRGKERGDANGPLKAKRAHYPPRDAWFLRSDENKSLNLFARHQLVGRDVNSGDLAMSIALTRSGTATGAVLARATASDLR